MTRAIGCSATGILAVLALLAAVPTARGEDDQAYHDLVTLESTLELGTIYTSTDDFKFGDYTGLTQQGWDVLGNADIRFRSPYDATLPYYLRVRGMNLGLDSRRVDALVKMPGRFGLSFVFDQIPKYVTDDALSPYKGAGTETLNLPPGWVRGNTPQPGDMPTLQASLRDLSIHHKRETLGGGLSLVLNESLTFDASYQHQTKKGDKFTSGVFGTTGGNPKSIVIPEPVDYEFHRIDSHLNYSTDQFQVQLQYYGSGFENHDDYLRFQNPYLPAGDWTADPTFGEKGLPPDNWFHQGVFSAGVELPLNSRLMLNSAFGWGTQHDDFLDYSFDPALETIAGVPNDLDGKVRTGMASVRFTSNPLPKLGILVGYRWDERDNKTPVDTWFRVRNDVEPQDVDNRMINRPYGWDKQHVDADLSYEIISRTKLTLSYDWEEMDRTYQEVKRMTEHTYGAKLVSHPHRRVQLGARFERAYRNAHGYDCVRPWVEATPPQVFVDEGETPGCSPADDFENHPDLRKYYEADRRRTKAHLWSNFVLRDDLTLSINSRYTHDDYHDSELGLTDFRSFSPGVDLSYSPTERVTFNVFYQYEETRSKMDSVEWVSFGPAANQDPFNPANGWSNRDKDIIHTAGAGLEFVAIPERLKFSLDYLFARSREKYDVNPNTGNPDNLPGAPNRPFLWPFPDATTELHDVSVRSELQLTRNLSLRLGYLYEHFKSRDWAVDRVCPACLDYGGGPNFSSVIASGQDSPDYDAHVGSVSVIFEF